MGTESARKSYPDLVCTEYALLGRESSAWKFGLCALFDAVPGLRNGLVVLSLCALKNQGASERFGAGRICSQVGPEEQDELGVLVLQHLCKGRPWLCVPTLSVNRRTCFVKYYFDHYRLLHIICLLRPTILTMKSRATYSSLELSLHLLLLLRRRRNSVSDIRGPRKTVELDLLRDYLPTFTNSRESHAPDALPCRTSDAVELPVPDELIAADHEVDEVNC